MDFWIDSFFWGVRGFLYGMGRDGKVWGGLGKGWCVGVVE